MAWPLTTNIQQATEAADAFSEAALSAVAVAAKGFVFSSSSPGTSPASGNSSDDAKASAQAELNIINIDEEAARLQADLDQHKQLVTDEEAVATKMGEHVTDLQNSLQESNDQLQKMRDAAGLGDSSGVGAEKKKLTDDLNEARARLQYLEDTSKGTKDDLAAIETQKKAVDDLTTQLNDAEKRIRIADYELTHSDAYKQQLQQIADQQAAIVAEQQKQADEKKHLDELKEDLATREAAAQKLADERAAQQAILNKQQNDAQAAATAQRKADLEKELGVLTEHTTLQGLTLHAAAAEAVTDVQTAVNQASTTIQGTVGQATQTIGTVAATAVTDAGTRIAAHLSAAMKSLLDLVSGGDQTSQDVSGGAKGRDIGSQFAGQFFDDTGQIAGGAIGDPTYATWVQAFMDSKKRYEEDAATPGRQGFQFQEARQQQQLEAIWQQLGGLDRFHKTLDQIWRMLKDQSSAVASIASNTKPPVAPPISTARLALHLPKPAPRPPTGDSLRTLIMTGRL